MKDRGSRQRRSPLEWGVRLVLAGAVGWIGYLSVMQSVALVLPDSRIEEAHALAPHNGRIAGRLSQTLYRSGASEADQARAVTIARDALQHDPTAVEAVARSEARRVGKECVSTCRSRGLQYH